MNSSRLGRGRAGLCPPPPAGAAATGVGAGMGAVLMASSAAGVDADVGSASHPGNAARLTGAVVLRISRTRRWRPRRFSSQR